MKRDKKKTEQQRKYERMMERFKSFVDRPFLKDEYLEEGFGGAYQTEHHSLKDDELSSEDIYGEW